MHRNLISSAVLVLAGLSAAPAMARPAAAPQAEVTTQLPRNVRPSHYRVSLIPDAAASTFAGRVVVSIEVLEPTTSITLNAAELAFSGAVLSAASGKGAPASARISVNAKEQTATFSFARPIAKGSYRLALDYSGVIGSQATGLFALDYDSAAGKQRALYTQFENSEARRMIPSWDEPNYKATFTLDVTLPQGETAVSNMPVAATRALPDGRSLVQFAPSPKMSTYLLFFASGQFERATRRVDGVEVGVITKKGYLAQADFALNSSAAILREYNDYFGLPYPLPKLDNIAAPGRSQFFGAMENWGAIFTFENALLLDPAMATQGDRQNIFATAAHEIAHQWFGDLVTMRWWDDLWLNEGFASWMESRMTARLHPEWNSAMNAIDGREAAMGRDALATSHPVVQRIATVEQASQAFDAITYQKGEAVIAMLEDYVGADAWRSGVRAYMKRHAYGNTVSDDFWTKVEKAAGKPITAIAHDFTLQAGVPMIKVEDAVCEGGATRVTLSQGEFSKDQPNKAALRWRVPVVARIGGAGQPARTLVSDGRATLTVPGCGALIVNAGQSGYYRTLYAPRVFAQMSAGFAALAPIDQSGILANTWALGLAGQQPMSDFLDLAQATPLDAAPQVWSRIAGVFANIHRNYRDEPQRQKRFAAFAIARLAPKLAQVGWDARAGEADIIGDFREGLIATMSELGDAATIAEARRRHAERDSEPGAVPPALRELITSIVARHADAATWDALRAAANAEPSPMIKSTMFRMLSASDDAALARRALDLALTDEPGVTNSASMIGGVAENHPELAFDFALSHLEQVNGRVDVSSRSRYFPHLAGGSAEPATIAKLEAYADAHLEKSSRREADTVIAVIQYRIKVRKERLPAVDAWLERQVH